MPSESGVQSDVVAYARSFGIISKKLSFGEGWPDYIFVFAGKILFIEFKAPDEPLRPLQEEIVSLLREQGATVYVVDSVSLGIQILNTFFNLCPNS